LYGGRGLAKKVQSHRKPNAVFGANFLDAGEFSLKQGQAIFLGHSEASDFLLPYKIYTDM
jgi:hypothetical protein